MQSTGTKSLKLKKEVYPLIYTVPFASFLPEEFVNFWQQPILCMRGSFQLCLTLLTWYYIPKQTIMKVEVELHVIVTGHAYLHRL